MLPIFKTQRRLTYTSIVMALILPFAITLGTSTPLNAETKIPQAASHKNNAGKNAPLQAPQPTPLARPVRSVSLVAPKIEMWADQIEARGHIMPWQETRIGTEIGGLRLVSVLANAGDVVKKGQVLARLNPATVEIELEAVNAQLMEAQAARGQAMVTLERAKRLAPSGGVSQQELTLYETQQQTTEARLNAAKAQVKTQQLRLDSATLTAPDDGTISSRSAIEGAIVPAGSELFRLIRQGRLEWRAEVKGDMLIKLSIGQEVTIKSPLGADIKGRVRQISPTIDLKTQNGLLYVDLPPDTNLKAGLYVSGTLAMGKRKTLVLPASAVQRSGNGYRALQVAANGKVEAVDVEIGRARDGRMEILAGLDEHAQVIAKNIDSLKVGDAVNVLEAHEDGM